MAEERGWPAEGTSVPTANKNDPDGSPLENWYLPCGLFLPSRTFPSGPLPRVGMTGLERKPQKSVRRQATMSSLDRALLASRVGRILRPSLTFLAGFRHRQERSLDNPYSGKERMRVVD